jgi:HEPN domain-containing protein
MSVPDEALRWFSFAREDLATARACFEQPEIPARQSCYFAQQAAEKAIKALLIANGGQVPRSHDLDFLRNKLPPGARLHSTHPSLSDLTEWVVGARYPDAYDAATDGDAAKALETASEVLASIQLDLESLAKPEANGS